MREFDIIFRQINDPRPSNWLDGAHWYVEAHDSVADMGFPIGTAYVLVAPEMQFVEFVLVADQYRREGVATALLDAIDDRWPAVMLTGAISESGQGLLDKVQEQTT